MRVVLAIAVLLGAIYCANLRSSLLSYCPHCDGPAIGAAYGESMEIEYWRCGKGHEWR